MNRLLLFIVTALLLSAGARGQQLVSAEYFFNNDPGTGNGTALTITSGDTVNFSGTIPSTGLSDGFHKLGIRVKDNAGVWSLSEQRIVFLFTNIPVQALSSAEYFFDNDPGTGNATSLPVTGGDTIQFSGSLPAGSLTDGFHVLHIRTRSSDGIWSLVERRMVYVGKPAPAPLLADAEYFVDTDPGFGAGSAIGVTGGDTITFTGPMSVSVVDTGSHWLYIRTRDASGVWSIYEPREFQISNSITVQELGSAGKPALYQNSPNPFSGITTLTYFLPSPSRVSFFITDMLGRVVHTVSQEQSIPGNHRLELHDTGLPGGNYAIRMVAGDFTDTLLMTVLK